MIKTRNQPAEPGITRGEYIFGVIFFLAALAGQCCLIGYLYDQLTDVEAIQVRKVQIKGNLKYLTQKDVEDYFMAGPESRNLYTMDPVRVREYMESMPWINRVTIQKKLPDILAVRVTEHEPLAYFNDGVLVSDWSVIYPGKTDLGGSFPYLSGPDNLARAVYETYCDLDNHLRSYGFRIARLNLDDNFIWDLELEGGLKLRLGRDETVDSSSDFNNRFISRLNNFIDVYPHIQDKNNIEYIDLRYDTGVAVKWFDSSGATDGS